MHVDVRGVDVGLSQVLRGKVARLVQLALAPFKSRIRKVTVSLTESADSRRDSGRRCRMRVWLKGRGELGLDAFDADFEAAAARAAAELAKRLAAPRDERPSSRRRGPC